MFISARHSGATDVGTTLRVPTVRLPGTTQKGPMKKTVRPSATPSRRGPRNHRILRGQVKVTIKVRKLCLGFHPICNRPGWDFRDLASYIKARRGCRGGTLTPHHASIIAIALKRLRSHHCTPPRNQFQTSRTYGITLRGPEPG